MAKVYDVVAKIGEYEGKGKYKNVGMVNKNDQGHLSIKIDHPITIADDGSIVQWLGLFEPKEKTPSSGGESSSGGGDEFEDDSIPF